MKVITFGEIMLRLAPKGYYRFFQNNEFEATFGGGEANVAVSLRNYGIEAEFVTKVPNNDIGLSAIAELNSFGVNTSNVVLGGNRLGIYYLEKGASQRASKVVYDRANSSISEADIDDFDWDSIFEGADWFHFTGITPALGENLVELTLLAAKKAREKGITVSCDLNYRKLLWTTEEARIAMTKIAPYINVLIANEEDAEKVYGIESHATDITSGTLNHEGYIDVAKQLTEKFGFEKVGITLRESISASDNNWSAMLYCGGNAYFSKTYPIHIVDRVGGGDSFGGGLIYSLLNNYDPQSAIEFAVAASCLKQTIEGDFNRVSVKEVQTLMNGDGSGRVLR